MQQPSLDEKLKLASAMFGAKSAASPSSASHASGGSYLAGEGINITDRVISAVESDPTVPAWAKRPTKPTYTAAEVGADASGEAAKALDAAKVYADQQIAAIPTPDVSGQIGTHNVATDAHNDIRLFIQDLTARVNALADSDDDTLDQMSEIVAYIKANRELVEQVTNAKVSVSDIIDNLTTNVGDKPLSAAQGVALKQLIDAIVVPAKVSQLENDMGYMTSLPYRISNYQNGNPWITNPNDVTETGFYYIATNDGTNRPPFSQSTNSDYRVLTTAYSSDWLQQIATDFRCRDVFLRRRESGTWTAWEQLAYINDIPKNVSAFANDAGYLNAIPSEYVTQTELDAKAEEIFESLNTGTELPGGYTQVEYIESTGSQYIDTLCKLNMPTKVRYRYMPTSTSGDLKMFGEWEDGRTASYHFAGSVNGMFYFWNYGDLQTSVACNAGEVYEVEAFWGSSNCYYKVNGSDIVAESGSSSFVGTYSAFVFAGSNKGTPISHTSAKLYYLQIENENGVVRNYVPAKRSSDGKAGLYDLVDGAFYANAGSGEFLVGPSVGITPITQGGTGAGNASDARKNLGAAPEHIYSTEDLTAGSSALATGTLYLVYE